MAFESTNLPFVHQNVLSRRCCTARGILFKITSFESIADAEQFLEPHLFVYVTWLLLQFRWRDENTVSSSSNDGVFPGRVPLKSLSCNEWNFHFVVPPRDVLRRPCESLRCAHIELIRLLRKRIRGVSEELPVPIDSVLDTWAFRSCEESLYGTNLADVMFEQWAGTVAVHDDALILKCILLFVDLSSLAGRV